MNESFRDYSGLNNNQLAEELLDGGYNIVDYGKSDIIQFNIDIESDNPQELLLDIKNAWKDTKEILAVCSQGIKQREIHQFLENICSTPVTPIAPGIFFIFKNDMPREKYLYSIQRRDRETDVDDAQLFINEKEDLLVYLALARFRSENVVSNLPDEIQNSVKQYLGSFLKAVSLSKKLLFTTGNKAEIIELCEDAPAGMNDDESFYIHSSAVHKLDVTLRVFIGMAGIFYGDINNSDIIKLHKNSIKISFYDYDDFNKALPELHSRIKIDLAKQQMNYYNHRSKKNQQLLYIKEEYVLETHPEYQNWKTLSETLKAKGLKNLGEYGPSLQELPKILDKEFLNKIYS